VLPDGRSELFPLGGPPGRPDRSPPGFSPRSPNPLPRRNRSLPPRLPRPSPRPPSSLSSRRWTELWPLASGAVEITRTRPPNDAKSSSKRMRWIMEDLTPLRRARFRPISVPPDRAARHSNRNGSRKPLGGALSQSENERITALPATFKVAADCVSPQPPAPGLSCPSLAPAPTSWNACGSPR
jgi:hypothetical protein